MYGAYKTITETHQPLHDAGCDAFTPVWLGKQPTDEARKQKKEKEKKTDIVFQTKKKSGAIGWCKRIQVCIYHQHRKQIIANQTWMRPDAHAVSHTIVL